MEQDSATTRLKALFKFPFQQGAWNSKFWTGAALTMANYIVPIVPMLFVQGYLFRVMSRAINGQLVMPEWDDWGKMFIDGLRLFLVMLVYSLPGIVIMTGGWIIYFVASFVFPLVVPLLLIGSSADAQGMAAAVAGTLMMTGLFGSLLVLMATMLLGSILIILAMVVLPVAVANFVDKNEVAAAFRIREWWPLLRANKLGFFAAWVIALGLMSVVAIVVNLAYYTIVLCCVIPVIAAPISFYGILVVTAVFGQTYRDGAEMVGTSPDYLQE